ncbi:sugar nucleotide-binding protein [Tessaracoccus massiliensis]|uniref:sugar nucleotide-binding protein n=1 Tax=Tessaracoccus massiliensis TaxID=1522311 RepID=UPI00058FB36F|nr:bifunctional dTDP-4-dehydrorhamnose 3,5-epimerase family protein/NAD(P)-dependent oxidoreductase [Tessaracoccus massiliensis]
MTTPTVSPTDIPGLLVVDLPVHGDSRGWFKEGWQREKMVAAGLPDFGPVQNNLSFNAKAGVTRGFHAEPWDKLVSVATGRVFGAWIDLRDGATFGRVFTIEIDAGRAVFVPRGVGNAYQALEDGTCYTYLVNEHWSAEAKSRYTFTHLGHPAVDWPIPLSDAVLSDADQNHPQLADVEPFALPRPLVTGADGQLGRALRRLLPNAVFTDRAELDITDADAVAAYEFSQTSAIINAAAWTAVDAAEGEGRAACWAVNVTGPANLAATARRHRLPLIHISSDYVFDGEAEHHDEDETFTPLSAYGAAKAAGDALVATWPHHYILRTSWVVGDGPNFVRTMARLADQGASPSVVADQHGRLTFADDLARAVQHVLTGPVPYGTYNVTSDGDTMTWFDVARAVFDARGAEGEVSPTTTAEFSAGRAMAPRPRHSTLSLDKIKATGFEPADGMAALRQYLGSLE